MKPIFAAILAATLVGCGTTPKPTLTYPQTVTAGRVLGMVSRCASDGNMDIHTASRVKGFVDNYLARTQHDAYDVTKGYDEVMKSVQPPPRNTCTELSVSVLSKINEVNAQNQAAAQNRRELKDAIDSFNNSFKRPAFTNCNTYGSQTLCSTY